MFSKSNVVAGVHHDPRGRGLVQQATPILDEVKRRYEKLRAHLATLDDPRWQKLVKPSIITGMVDWDKTKGAIGYNVNKGYEIGICLRGDDANSAFYVLLHELAHITVSEYDH